jgi:hypothetical protein
MKIQWLTLVLVGCWSGGSSVQARVAAHVAESERTDVGQIEVEAADPPSVGDVSLWNVTVLVPDHPGERCAMQADDVWCDKLLEAATVGAGWAADPSALTAAEWNEWVWFAVGGTPVTGPGGLLLLREVPPEVAAAIATPSCVVRADSVDCVATYEVVAHNAYPAGPKSLTKVEVSVTSTGVRRTQETVWDGEKPSP